MSWVKKRLDGVIQNTIDYRGKTPPHSESGIPVISAANVKNGKVTEAKKFVTEETYNNWTTRGFIKAGDVLITTEAPVGEVATVPDDQIDLITRRVIALQIDPEIADEIFVKYYLQTDIAKKRISNKAHGSTVPRVFKEDILNIELSVPPLPTQRRIASILSAYDDLIENNLKRIKLLEEAAQNIYREWFVEMRFPGHEQAEWYTDDEGRRLPVGWEYQPFEDLIDFKEGPGLRN